MDIAKANKWWQKAMNKHALKESHHPKAKRRFEVKTRDSSFVPVDGKKMDRYV